MELLVIQALILSMLMIVMVTTGWGVMIISMPCLDFSFPESQTMDLRNSNTPKFALALCH